MDYDEQAERRWPARARCDASGVARNAGQGSSALSCPVAQQAAGKGARYTSELRGSMPHQVEETA